MTTKRDSKRKPKDQKQPKLEKQTIKDLAVRDSSREQVKGGSRNIPTADQP